MATNALRRDMYPGIAAVCAVPASGLDSAGEAIYYASDEDLAALLQREGWVIDEVTQTIHRALDAGALWVWSEAEAAAELADPDCPPSTSRVLGECATAYIIKRLQQYLELARAGRNPGPWWQWVSHEPIAAMVNLRDVDEEVELAFGVASARAWQARVAAHSGEATAPPEGWTIWAEDDYCYAQAPGVQVLPDTPRGIGDGFKRGNQWRVDLRTGDVECRSVSGIGGHAAWNMWFQAEAPEWLLDVATAMARQRSQGDE